MLRRVEIDGGGREENMLLRPPCRVEIGLGANGRFREERDVKRLRVIRRVRERFSWRIAAKALASSNITLGRNPARASNSSESATPVTHPRNTALPV